MFDPWSVKMIVTVQRPSQEFLNSARPQRVFVIHHYQIDMVLDVSESSTSSGYGSGLVYEYERK